MDKFNVNHLPKTKTNPPIPILNQDRNTGLCDTCIKVDVCQYKDDLMKAISDIALIESGVNVFMNNELTLYSEYYNVY